MFGFWVWYAGLLSLVGRELSTVKAALPPKGENGSHMQQRQIVTVVCLPHQDVSGPQELCNKEI